LIDFGLVLMTGLFASLHCVGMCGPIVLAYSAVGSVGVQAQSRANLLTSHLAWNGGRILSYMALGVVAGSIGAAVASRGTFGSAVSLAGGFLMVLFGLLMLGLSSGVFSGSVPASVRRFWGTLLKKKSVTSRACIGCLTPLLPCGVLYAMVVKAGTTESALGGGLTMGLFGLGMAPSLVLMGSVSSVVSAKFRKHAEKLAAAMIILMGVMLMLRGLHISLFPMAGGHG
jgi:sulfite exporter TauE/SafE